MYPFDIQDVSSYCRSNPDLNQEIAPGALVIPDQYINLVPNVGIVIGTDAVLVIESGMGRENS